jgi:cysteine desulfuration protein SufE
MKSIEKEQNEIIEEFSLFPDWEEKYSYIIEKGMEIPPMPDIYKTKENIVLGCQSQVWLISDYDKNTNLMHYQADSDA